MPEPLLDVRALDAYYGDFQALFRVSLRVAAGEVVAVIGANGAGKSTLLNASPVSSRRVAMPSCSTTSRSATRPRTQWSRAASRSCRKGAGSSPRSQLRKTC